MGKLFFLMPPVSYSQGEMQSEVWSPGQSKAFNFFSWWNYFLCRQYVLGHCLAAWWSSFQLDWMLFSVNDHSAASIMRYVISKYKRGCSSLSHDATSTVLHQLARMFLTCSVEAVDVTDSCFFGFSIIALAAFLSSTAVGFLCLTCSMSGFKHTSGFFCCQHIINCCIGTWFLHLFFFFSAFK